MINNHTGNESTEIPPASHPNIPLRYALVYNFHLFEHVGNISYGAVESFKHH